MNRLLSIAARPAVLTCALLLALTGTAQAINKGYYSSDAKPKAEAKKLGQRWMKGLSEKKKLSELSIPGTHDTCALYGGDLAQCQAWSLQDQLEAGIRFVDIRCRHIEDVFTIHHGPVYQKINFGKVRDICEAFLKANPSECILMSIKEEHKPAKNKKKFGEVFACYLQGREKFWYTKGQVPTLKEARGKIVVVSRADGVSGLAWNTLKIQDDYQVPTLFAIPGKWKKVNAHLDAARKGKNEDVYVNFSSGTGGGAYPYTVARNVNHDLFNRLKGFKGRAGILVMDFPGEQLIERIIRLNR